MYIYAKAHITVSDYTATEKDFMRHTSILEHLNNIDFVYATISHTV